MIFSKLGKGNLPLWWLIFKQVKTVTRRPPPCKHCGKKEFDHLNAHSVKVCPKPIAGKVGTTYEPDLSRWMPKRIDMPPNPDGMFHRTEYKEIAVQPKRTFASICRNCGGFKDWHNFKPQGITRHFVGMTVEFDVEPNQFYFHTTSTIKHKICSNYEPLKVKIKSVNLESEWRLREVARLGYCPTDEEMNKEEAAREGFNTWNDLQEALGMYPKNTRLARLEFEVVK